MLLTNEEHSNSTRNTQESISSMSAVQFSRKSPFLWNPFQVRHFVWKEVLKNNYFYGILSNSIDFVIERADLCLLGILRLQERTIEGTHFHKNNTKSHSPDLQLKKTHLRWLETPLSVFSCQILVHNDQNNACCFPSESLLILEIVSEICLMGSRSSFFGMRRFIWTMRRFFVKNWQTEIEVWRD